MPMIKRMKTVTPRPAALLVGLPDLYDFLRRRLGEKGYWVSACASATEAVQHVNAYHPDLILADLRLPDLTGMELAGILRRTSSSSAVVLVGNEEDQSLTLSVLRSGAGGLLLRPVQPEDLDPWTRKVSLTLRP
jgi:two-component system C4-dicarboxylate transport response regulator DctD